MNNNENFSSKGFNKGLAYGIPLSLFFWVAILSIAGALPFIKAYFIGG